MTIKNFDVTINNNWISVRGIGRIGRYLNDTGEIAFDYSMIWIIRHNERIKCDWHDIPKEVVRVINKN